jgi:Xaa-Pro aminopeptidase
VVVFEVDEEELVERLLARGRADDTEETIRTRFQIYLDQTAPLLETYQDAASSSRRRHRRFRRSDRADSRQARSVRSNGGVTSMISIKSRREFAKMEKAGATVAEVHRAVREAAAPERLCSTSRLSEHE